MDTLKLVHVTSILINSSNNIRMFYSTDLFGIYFLQIIIGERFIHYHHAPSLGKLILSTSTKRKLSTK